LDDGGGISQFLSPAELALLLARAGGWLRRIESEVNYTGLQNFLACVQAVSQEQRLSRFLYTASKPANPAERPHTKFKIFSDPTCVFPALY